MAKIQKELYGNFDDILAAVYDSALNTSTAQMIESSDFKGSESRCAVMIFERYSIAGDTRVTLSVTLFETEGRKFISAVSSGGSNARFVKINTWGEESYLDDVRYTINSFSRRRPDTDE